MKPTYLIPDPDAPDVRLRLTRPANDVVINLFTVYPDHGPVLIASGATNEPHARYTRNPDGSVTWSARVISRPNKRPRTVAQSPNVGTWVDMGVLTPTTPTITRDPTPDDTWEFEPDADADDKWSRIFRQREARQALRDAGLLRLWYILSQDEED